MEPTPGVVRGSTPGTGVGRLRSAVLRELGRRALFGGLSDRPLGPVAIGPDPQSRGSTGSLSIASTAKAHYLIAIASNDDEAEPEVKNVLRETFAKAGLPAEIEVYQGALHGWCPPDSHVYNEAQAERAWGRLLALFDGALKSA